MEQVWLVQCLNLNKISYYSFKGIVVECNIGLDVIEHRYVTDIVIIIAFV
jgi:hypothetical protein